MIVMKSKDQKKRNLKQRKTEERKRKQTEGINLAPNSHDANYSPLSMADHRATVVSGMQNDSPKF